MTKYITLSEMPVAPLENSVLKHVTVRRHTFENGIMVSVAQFFRANGAPAGDYLIQILLPGPDGYVLERNHPMNQECQREFQVNLVLREIAELDANGNAPKVNLDEERPTR